MQQHLNQDAMTVMMLFAYVAGTVNHICLNNTHADFSQLKSYKILIFNLTCKLDFCLFSQEYCILHDVKHSVKNNLSLARLETPQLPTTEYVWIKVQT